jgi:hypothetical protein
MRQINNKLIAMVKYFATLSPENLEKTLINRAILDRCYLMRKDQIQNHSELLEYFKFSFRDLILLEKYFDANKENLQDIFRKLTQDTPIGLDEE